MNIFDKVFNYLYDAYDYVLGRDDQYYQNMAKSGKQLKGQQLNEFFEKKANEKITEIIIVGQIEYSRKEFESQKELIESGNYKPFFL